MDEDVFFKLPETRPFPGVDVAAAESCSVPEGDKTPSSPTQTCDSCSLKATYLT